MVSKKALEKLNIFSETDLLHHYPFRYEDLTHATIGTIVSSRNLYLRSGKTIQKIILQTKTNNQELTFFNQPYLVKTLKPGLKLSFCNQNYEIVTGKELIHTGRLIPIYPETKGLSSKWLRRRIYNLLQKTSIPDWLPKAIAAKYCLIDLNSALRQIHFPKTQGEIDSAAKRLAFDEMLLLQLNTLIRRQAWQQKKLGHRLTINQVKILNLINHLPFKLTAAQNRVLKEISVDLNRPKPMNRLLQGEVGSGKTIVAALAAYICWLNHCRTIVMAPTEILAQQHYATFKTIFTHLPLKIALVTAGVKNQTGDILIGTQALLHRKIDLDQLGLLIIDEQHRFGVGQRSQLLSNSKITPHLLTMTATPIPRTIALTAYADLDLSVLDEMPLGRQPIKTWVVPHEKRLNAYSWIAKEITGRHTQAFIVCPLIETSNHETMSDIKNVTEEFKQLKSIFPDFSLELLHGRLKSIEKQSIIKRFQNNQTNILVTTPVIEVGLDIPNAAIMVIEGAERFGLAQLHQLRGRVGRSDKISYCLLFTTRPQPEIKRLKYLETINSGLKLAEIDLKLRGPGSFYGLQQHGFLNLKLASFTDMDLINKTKAAAATLLNSKAWDKIKTCLRNQKEKFPPDGRASAATSLN